MSEPVNQPLLQEQQGEGATKPRKRPTKPRTAKAAGTVKPRAAAKKTAARKKKTADAGPAGQAQLDLSGEIAAEAAPGEASPAQSQPAPAGAAPDNKPVRGTAPDPVATAPASSLDLEDWRPSARPSRNVSPNAASLNSEPQSSSSTPAAVDPPGNGADMPPAPPAAAASSGAAPARQYPVYIPRHVARQMEESGKAAPLAVAPEEAAKMDLPLSSPSAEAAPVQAEAPRTETVREEELGTGEGIVEISGKGFGFIRDPNRGFAQHPSDIFVTPEVVRSFNLRDGQWLKGQIRRGNRGAQLYRLQEINGEAPELSRTQPAFDELTVISPLERFRLETVPERYTTRILDLMAPIGKGQRGLIVAPPRTGKTTLLQHIADAIGKNHPETKLILLLVDERPEEVTDFKRTIPNAEIMASSNDMDVKSHTRIAQLAIDRAKRLAEAGKDVFVLLDSITRVGRAFNNAMSGGGRTMSGGIDSRALEIPRKLFAAGRNTEEAGSLTIIATALIETGSRMDELIFQEFKGTGNMELALDRKISDQRIYPAIDIFLSGTRREELLIPADDLHKIGVIRRGLAGYKPIEAIERLLFFMKKFPTNAQMLQGIPG
ncbi:MAG: transcription termination factor Rho [Verrucomicrobiota bacterium]|nr:transcription termination factor Rho [Verrucomicrobiota bacterium]